MVKFILNEQEIKTNQPPGLLLLDFIRYHQHLMGTKIGCREGDCGACTILVGEIKNNELIYSSATSCLMPIGNAAGKHIVTIEGINVKKLNIIQEAFADEGATQCGFCTPGFIVSLAGFCMSSKLPSYSNAIDSVNGNICRCTGYKSIERAAQKVTDHLLQRNQREALSFAVSANIIPAYFLQIKDRLQHLDTNKNDTQKNKYNGKFLGGGTDLYVQQPDTIVGEPLNFLSNKDHLKGIIKHGNTCEMGAACVVTDILDSPIFREYFPGLQQHLKLVSSTPIRNMATIAGNFTNASPIGDLTIFFLALNAQLELSDGENKRSVALRSFYKGYKQLDKLPAEFIEKIVFKLPGADSFFNFEKVSKRTHLDIASVNTAIHLVVSNGIITEASLSAGGVGPVPTWLSVSSMFLSGKKIDAELISEVIEIAQKEILPISDARGSAEYKRLLLAQLIKAHFIVLFPWLPAQKLLSAR